MIGLGTAAVADGSGRNRMLPDTIFRLVPSDPARFLPPDPQLVREALRLLAALLTEAGNALLIDHQFLQAKVAGRPESDAADLKAALAVAPAERSGGERREPDSHRHPHRPCRYTRARAPDAARARRPGRDRPSQLELHHGPQCCLLGRLGSPGLDKRIKMRLLHKTWGSLMNMYATLIL